MLNAFTWYEWIIWFVSFFGSIAAFIYFMFDCFGKEKFDIKDDED